LRVLPAQLVLEGKQRVLVERLGFAVPALNVAKLLSAKAR
jgi:hypothetical protein